MEEWTLLVRVGARSQIIKLAKDVILSWHSVNFSAAISSTITAKCGFYEVHTSFVPVVVFIVFLSGRVALSNDRLLALESDVSVIHFINSP